MNNSIKFPSYINDPIDKYKDFKLVNWEKEIYPRFKGKFNKKEINFFIDLIKTRKLKNILDLGVGGGVELAGIIKELKKQKYNLEAVEANEINDDFIIQASRLFCKNNIHVLIHKANWIDLPNAVPQYKHKFDFAFLTGNSLSYLVGGSREYSKNNIKSVIAKFNQLLSEKGYLFIDTRNFDYIRSLINLPISEIVDNFNFDYSVYYHGSKKDVLVIPTYISDTIIVFHYYNLKQKTWSRLDYFPIYQYDMIEMLNHYFNIEKVYCDFSEDNKNKSLFIQYLVKKKL